MTDYSTIFDFIEASVEELKARPGLTGVQVTEDWPGNEQEEDCIWFWDAYSVDNVEGMRAGTIGMNEVYTVKVVIDVKRDGEGPEVVRARLRVLHGEVLAWLAEGKRFEVLPGKWVTARSSGFKFEPYRLKMGRGAYVRIDIKVSGQRRP